MQYRQATVADITQIQIVRNAVKENTLSNPNLVTDSDCAEYITNRGNGWVCVVHNTVVGFAIVDLAGHNIWALFVHPEYEQQGIGKHLQQLMLSWYFAHTTTTVWLGTEYNTRAETFYKKTGWRVTGTHGASEVKLEMNYSHWLALQ